MSDISHEIHLNDLRLRILNGQEVTSSEMAQVIEALREGRVSRLKGERAATSAAKKASGTGTGKASVVEVSLSDLF